VVGVAGIARSLPTDAIAAELVPVLEALAALEPQVVQYKACSTADSSPEIGSIGRVIELGREVISPHVVPVLIAQPDFGRFTAFGHHFAAEDGIVYRLDRQPTMATHPSTPIHESDLAVLFGGQTKLPIAQLSFIDYGSPESIASDLSRSTAAAVVLDALSDEHLKLIGNAILQLPPPVFAIGAGGLSRALASAAGEAPGEADSATRSDAGLRAPGPTLAVSGSRSPRTLAQLEVARKAGWAVVPMVVSPSSQADHARDDVVELLASGRNVVLSAHDTDFSGIAGPDVLPTIAATAAAVVDAAVTEGVTGRVIVSGGDTSSRVVRLLGVRSFTIVANPWANIVILSAHASGSAIDGVELMLKGGQVGGDDVLLRVQALGSTPSHGDASS
jgi:uncharacterized protein YgbK (DUF1537 family)